MPDALTVPQVLSITKGMAPGDRVTVTWRHNKTDQCCETSVGTVKRVRKDGRMFVVYDGKEVGNY